MPSTNQPDYLLTLISAGENETRRLGCVLGRRAAPGLVIALIGELGTGKTRFAQGFGAGAGVPPAQVINSPTFTLINQYAGRLPVYHLDLYRLNSAVEAETLGLDDFFYGDGVCLIEWADRLADDLPPERLEIDLRHLDEMHRRIELRAFGEEYAALLAESGLSPDAFSD